MLWGKSEAGLVWSKSSVLMFSVGYNLLHFWSPRQYYALRTRAVMLIAAECLLLLEFAVNVGSDLTSRSEVRWLVVACREL